MNLHEIIHQYLRMGVVDGGHWLAMLVRDAGVSPELVKHIQGCEMQRISCLVIKEVQG